jgi:hypothetical protein
MFLFCAFVFDLHKWNIFILATKSSNIIDAEKYNREKKRLVWFTGVILFLIVGGSLSLMGILIALFDERHQSELYELVDDI